MTVAGQILQSSNGSALRAISTDTISHSHQHGACSFKTRLTKTATTLSEQVVGVRALKDSVEAFAFPIQSLVRRSMNAGLRQNYRLGNGKRPAFPASAAISGSLFLRTIRCGADPAPLVRLATRIAMTCIAWRKMVRALRTRALRTQPRPCSSPSVGNICDPHDGQILQHVDLSHSEQNLRTIKRACRKLSAMYHPDRACSPAKLKERSETIDVCEERVSAYFECVTEAGTRC